MQFYVTFCLLCVGQLVAAERRSRYEGLADQPDATSGEEQLWGKLEELGRNADFTGLHNRTMPSAGERWVKAVRRDVGTATDYSFQRPQHMGRAVEKSPSLVNVVPGWRRKLGDAGVQRSNHDSDRFPINIAAEAYQGSDANALFAPSTGRIRQSAKNCAVREEDNVKEHTDFPAVQDRDEAQSTEGGSPISDSEIKTRKENRVLADGAKRFWPDHPGLSAGKGYQSRDEKHNAQGTREGMRADNAHSDEPGQVTWKVDDYDNGDSEGLQNAAATAETQTVFETEEEWEGEHDVEGGYEGKYELRGLGKKRHFAAALPLKVPPVMAVTAPPQPATLAHAPIPAPPVHTPRPKPPAPPPQKAITFKKVYPPPKKVHITKKMPPPVKVIRQKQIGPPPKQHFLPKKVVYHTKKLSPPEKVHMKYVPTSKQYVPVTKFDSASEKFAPAPVYVPVPNKL